MKNKEVEIKKYLKWAIMVLAIIVFSLLAYLVQTGKISKFDNFVYSGVSKLQGSTMTKIVKVLTEFGDYFILCVIAIIVTIILKNKKEKIFIWINLSLVAVINYLLKQIFTRERPDVHLIDVLGYSFPSGHSAVSMAVYLYLIYLVMSRINIKWLKVTLISIMFVMILMVGTSRIYLGAHFVSDVLAGFCVGIVYNILFIEICYNSKIKLKLDGN